MNPPGALQLRVMAQDDDLGQIDPQVLIAVRRVKQAAEQGNLEACYRLGMMYGNGDGVPLDHAAAAEWMSRAAQHGHIEARLTMAWMYANGVGVDQDEERTRHWYRQAAEQGSAQAQYMLGTMYRFSQYGVEQDMAQAVDWYLKAADQGFAPAQFALGRLLMDGRYVERDEAAALQWLSLAHVNGSSKAEEVIEHLIKRMPAEQVQAVREAVLARGEGGA